MKILTPFVSFQMSGAPYGPPMYGDSRAPSWGPQQQAPPQQQPPPQQSPVPPQGPGTPTPQQQQQQYPSRPGQPATPNAHPPPDAGVSYDIFLLYLITKFRL